MSTVPPSFNPFATHRFTSCEGVLKPAPQPSPYPRPISSTHAPYPTSGSLPTAQTPSPLSPQPTKAGPGQHVFEPFKLERSSPDLKDVLSKKGVPTAKPSAYQKAK